MPATTSTPASEDVISLCHFGPSYCAPTLSPFVLKLETYLKMAEIPYKNEFTVKRSSKGKVPYIKSEEKEYNDTNFIIPYLNKKFEKDLNASLSPEERAVSLGFKRLIEENLYWSQVYNRWMDDFAAFSKLLPVTGLRKRLFPIVSAVSIKPNIRSSLHGHGLGRHSKEEIYQIMEKDLQALSDFMGDKLYLMGSEPTEIDASLFGVLAEGLYVLPGNPLDKFVRENLTNLLEYTNRMREKFWPDWEQSCLQEKKKEEVAEQQEAEENGKEAEGDKKVGKAGENAEQDGDNQKEENGAEAAAGDADDAAQKVEEQENASPEK